jgi:hypothetical protein
MSTAYPLYQTIHATGQIPFGKAANASISEKSSRSHTPEDALHEKGRLPRLSELRPRSPGLLKWLSMDSLNACKKSAEMFGNSPLMMAH